MHSRYTYTFLLFVICMQTSHAENTEVGHFELPLNEDTDVSITKFGNGGDRILWIPSEYGIRKQKHYSILESLAALKHEVWLAELHDSYFIPAGRSSYTEIPVDDISSLIENSLPDDKRKLFIVSTGRAAVLSAMALNQWQSETGGSERFGGIVMIHPNFQADTPEPGTAMQYLPIIDDVQLPIFIIQPKLSNKYWYLDTLVSRLSEAGSTAYTQIIEGASDGYHVRPGTSISEKQMAKQLPEMIARATRLLSRTKVAVQQKSSAARPWKVSSIAESLQPYPGNTLAHSIELTDTDDAGHRLHDYRGKVVVLNFWATWCPPCVEEIPSLGRLQRAFSNDDLVVLSIDIGESREDVESFLQKIPADFPVLLDPDGSTVKQWKIIAFPTTFIIDRKGIIKLAYFGGLEWDKPDVIRQLQELVNQ
ncbi:MAG: TlpA family protein disulfide reductase [Gammaproteobacteria bacterium]|nr:TlpA family protein disulfide reductase [Gammaproteobacteria bacterium]